MDLIGCRAVGRHDHDDVADRAGKDAATCHGGADADSCLVTQIEGLSGAPIFDQFDADDEADLANVTDVRMRPEGGQFVVQGSVEASASAQGSLRFQQIEAGQGGGGGERIGGVTVAVEEGLELGILTQEGVEDGLRCERGGHGEITAGQSLGEGYEIGLNSFRMGGEEG